MQKISPPLHLTAEEKALLEISDEEAERLLENAQEGNVEAKDKLYCWAYLTAYQYFNWSAQRENAIAVEDAEDLTAAFFLEFESTLPRLKSAARFTRHVIKQNLQRYIKRKKIRQHREILTPDQALENKAGDSAAEAEVEPWKDWTEEQFMQYRAVLEALKNADGSTQKIIQYRMEDPPLEHKEIAGLLKMSETSIRMRVTRFYSLVRKKYEKIRYFT